MPSLCNEQPSFGLLIRWGIYEPWVNGLLGFDSLPDGIGQVSLLDVECCLPAFCNGATEAMLFTSIQAQVELANPFFLDVCVG